MPRIRVLEQHVAELIAAGEVVERPASVVKELMENAIDAGATSVAVEIQRGGITYLRVTDNGCGIDRADIRNAFVSHATSKIAEASDLDAILTLGFRGEALASIAAVARVEVLTKTPEAEIGTRYAVEGAKEMLLDDAGCPNGTTIVVRDLFFNTPARMKFLKKDVTEGNAVAGVVDRIALSHPEVSVRFVRDGKEVLATAGDGKLRNTIFAVFGREFAESLLPCEYALNGIRAEGYISKPVHARANRTMQFFFLNGRLIKTRTGMAALEQAYKNAIMVGKFPACVLFLTVPAAAVDVNVHPAKTEVRFADEKRIFDAVYYCAKLALEQNDTRPQMRFEAKAQQIVTAQSMPQPPQAEQMRIAPRPPVRVVPPAQKNDTPPSTLVLRSPQETVPPAQVETEEDILLHSPPAPKPEKETVTLPVVETADPPELQPSETPVAAEPFRVIGEAFRTYILVEQGEKLLLIDKHAAHERMIYESLKKNVNDAERQLLLAPVTVTLSKEEYDAVLANADLLEQAGYAVEDFGQGMVLVTECPTFLEAGDLPSVLSELGGHLAENKKDLVPEKLDWIYHSTACRAAIKSGDRTTPYELESFVERLLADPDIRYCPHGRPVLIEMPKREIEKNFGRIQ